MKMRNCVKSIPSLYPFLTDEVCDKLEADNISNVLSFLMQNPENIAAKTRISYKVILNICKILNAHYGALQHSGFDIYNEAIKRSAILSTGYKSLDKLLGGGLLTEEIIEICGSSGVGKTSFCLSLSLQMSLKEKSIIYMDPMHSVQTSFITEKMDNFCNEKNLEAVLCRIHLLHPRNIWEVLQALEDILKSGKSSLPHDFDVIIIDSLPQLIYPLIGESQFESFGVLNHFAKILTQVVKCRKVTAIVVNHVIRSSAESTPMPALGRYWAHVPHTRLFFDKSFSDEKKTLSARNETLEEIVVHVSKSTRLKRGSCSITIK